MKNSGFVPFHLNATEDDLAGNDGIGRYLLLPGSDGRAKEIAEHFENASLKPHPRGHNLYLGTLTHEGKKIDVATVATGMGCPSVEIVLHELFQLGAKRFLRIGTAGSLQPDRIDAGNLINVQASVRDEKTTTNYTPIEVPAVASLEFVSTILLTAEKLGLSDILHTGIAHCKSSLYAREFGVGPRAAENAAYLKLMTASGILASEMETAALFIQSQIYNYQLSLQGHDSHHRVLAGAILAIVSTPKKSAPGTTKNNKTIENGVQLALETVKTLAVQERLG